MLATNIRREYKFVISSLKYSKTILKMSKKTKFFTIFVLGALNIDLISCRQFNYATPHPEPYATNINILNAKPIITPTPLSFVDNPIQLSRVHNTGSSLFFSTASTEKTQAIGGFLHNNTYNFFQSEYFWDLDLKPDAGNRINGIGSPVQTVLTYYNKKYGNFNTAVTKKDGIVQFVVFIYVFPFPNPLFYPFELLVQPVKKPHTSTIFAEFFSYNWFFVPSVTQDYYIFPGTYTNMKSSIKYNNPTVVFLIRVPLPYISYEQFNATFGSLRNHAGQPFSNKIELAPGDPKSLEHAAGVLLSFK